MKVGDILYRVDWDIGYMPGHEWWDDDECTTQEDREMPTVKLETWRVNTIRRKPAFILSSGILLKRQGLTVFIRRFDNGHGVKFKTKLGKVVGWIFDTTRTREDNTQFPVEKRPDEFRPTKKGAYKAAIASVRNDFWYKNGKDIKYYEAMRNRLIKQYEKEKS